jgi:hypothetical protein
LGIVTVPRHCGRGGVLVLQAARGDMSEEEVIELLEQLRELIEKRSIDAALERIDEVCEELEDDVEVDEETEDDDDPDEDGESAEVEEDEPEKAQR